MIRIISEITSALLLHLFIMINVFLGTIGILWYNTNLRIHEIGIKAGSWFNQVRNQKASDS